MAVATYTTDLANINLVETAGGTTNWSALGGGASGLASETDYYIQGDGCISKAGFTADIKGMIYNAGTQTVTAGSAVYIWLKQNNSNLMDTMVNGGQQVLIGNSTTAFKQFYIRGSNNAALDGWRCYAVDPTLTASATTGSPSGVVSYIGAQWKILGSGSLKGNPNGIDAFRHGRELRVANGESGAYGTFGGAIAASNTTANRWGLLIDAGGSYLQHGAFVMGLAGTAVDFRDQDRVIVCLDDPFVSAGFNEFLIRNASSNVIWTNINISALSTTLTQTWPKLTLDVGTFAGDACFFTRCAATLLASGQSMLNSTWKSSYAVTPAGANLSGSSILTPSISANTSGLIWNVATDPSGLLDDMTYTKTTAVAHHAIEFGTASPTSLTLNGCAFGSAFSATAGGTTGDETFHFKRTTGSVTLNLVGCSGNFGYRTDGAAITIVADPVTTTVTVLDTDGDPITGARVLVETANATGPFPYLESVSISQTAGVATVAHTGHGMVTNNYVVIRGAIPEAYNGAKQITVTGVNSYTFTIDSGTTSPATGSPVSSTAFISAVTSGTGILTDTRTFGSDQPIKGWARKTTSAPFYKTGNIVGTIDSVGGLSVTVQLISDE